jgi:hypothetical protein
MGAYVDTQKYLFCQVDKIWNGLYHCIPLVETVKKTYMERLIRSPDEGVMPPKRCSAVGTSDPSRDFRLPGLLTQVGSSDPCRDFRRSGLLIRVGTSGRPKGLSGSGLLYSDPNCSKLVGDMENKAWKGFLLG